MLVSSRWLALLGLVACLLVLVTVSAVQANGAHQADAAIETDTTQWAMLVDRLDSDMFDEYDSFFESESEVDVDVDVETDADADSTDGNGVSDEVTLNNNTRRGETHRGETKTHKTTNRRQTTCVRVFLIHSHTHPPPTWYVLDVPPSSL